MRYSSSDVYQHEMPGGQYTNLKFQATSLGLGDSWDKVQDSYAAANRALGDIVKVSHHQHWVSTLLVKLSVLFLSRKRSGSPPQVLHPTADSPIGACKAKC
jgi:pyruvate carboxylase